MKKADSGPAIMEHADVTYEPRDVNVRALLMIGIGILISAVVIRFGVGLAFDYYAAVDKTKGLQPSTLVHPDSVSTSTQPRLQVNAAEDLRTMRAAEAEVLHGYAWVDRKAGVVRIPIDQAMKILAERGLPSVGKQP